MWLRLKKKEITPALVVTVVLAIVGGAWAIYTYLFPPADKNHLLTQTITQTIQGNGNAIVQSDNGKIYITNIQGISDKDYARISMELGVTQAALKNFFKILERKQVPPENLDAILREIAKRYQILRQELSDFQSDDPVVLKLKQDAATALDQGQFDQVETLLKKARSKDLEAAKRLKETADKRLRSAAATAFELGNLKYTELAYADAARYYGEAVKILPAKYELERGGYMNHLGLVDQVIGQFTDAERVFNEALTIAKKSLPPRHPNIAIVLGNLAGVYQHQARYGKAELLYKESLDINKTALPPGHPQIATSLNNLAGLYLQQGRYAKAGSLYEEALDIVKKNLPPEDPRIAISLGNLAGVYLQQGRYAEAESLNEEALAIKKKTLPPGHPSIAIGLNNMAGLYMVQHRYAKAEPLFNEALAILKNVLPPDNPLIVTTRQNLARSKSCATSAGRC